MNLRSPLRSPFNGLRTPLRPGIRSPLRSYSIGGCSIAPIPPLPIEGPRGRILPGFERGCAVAPLAIKASRQTIAKPADLLDVADRRPEGLYGRSEATVRRKDARAHVRYRKGRGELLSGPCAVTSAIRRETTRASTRLDQASMPTVNAASLPMCFPSLGRACSASPKQLALLGLHEVDQLLVRHRARLKVCHGRQKGTGMNPGGVGVAGAGPAACVYDLCARFRGSPLRILAAASPEIFGARSLLPASRQVLPGALGGFGARPEGCMAGQRGAPVRFSAPGAVSGRRLCRNPSQRGSQEVFR